VGTSADGGERAQGRRIGDGARAARGDAASRGWSFGSLVGWQRAVDEGDAG
jgi:hypothetical protein